jgi:hypothetical protein
MLRIGGIVKISKNSGKVGTYQYINGALDIFIILY